MVVKLVKTAPPLATWREGSFDLFLRFWSIQWHQNCWVEDNSQDDIEDDHRGSQSSGHNNLHSKDEEGKDGEEEEGSKIVAAHLQIRSYENGEPLEHEHWIFYHHFLCHQSFPEGQQQEEDTDDDQGAYKVDGRNAPVGEDRPQASQDDRGKDAQDGVVASTMLHSADTWLLRNWILSFLLPRTDFVLRDFFYHLSRLP